MNDADPNRFRAPWDWMELAVDGDAPGAPPTTLVLEQFSGRTIRLTSLHQFFTYAGLLAGWPRATDSDAEAALRTAKHVFQWTEEEPAFLRPRLKRRPDTGKIFPGEPVARLPRVCSVAEFDSAPMNADRFQSSALVVWWQEQFGMPADEHILLQLRDLDWPAHAWDWDP